VSLTTVVDYGVVNLRNILRGLEHLGITAQVAREPELVMKSDRIILPGVGAFAAGMAELKSRDLDQALISVAKKGKPLLGICLGMQMLFDVSTENGRHSGLGLIGGKVVAIPKGNEEGGEKKRKVPHIGWNELNYPLHINTWEGSCLDVIERSTFFYFVHSYMAVPTESTHVLAQCDYEGMNIIGAVKKENITGLQFHPERSGRVGLQVLQRFISL